MRPKFFTVSRQLLDKYFVYNAKNNQRFALTKLNLIVCNDMIPWGETVDWYLSRAKFVLSKKKNSMYHFKAYSQFLLTSIKLD